MQPRTYDISLARDDYYLDIVGEFYNQESIAQLIRELNIPERKEEFFTAELVPEPDNPHSSSGNAISVRWHNLVLGHLAEEDAAEYQQLRRIAASGLVATCKARIWYFRDENSAELKAWIRLAIQASDLMLPVNQPPTEPWILLPHGAAVQVTKEKDHMDVLGKYVPPTGRARLITTLHIISAGVRTVYEAVEVRVDGQRIGELSRAMSPNFTAAVHHFQNMGYTPTCLAKVQGSSRAAEVTLYAAKAHELSKADFTPTAGALPPLVPYRDDAQEYPVPNAYYLTGPQPQSATQQTPAANPGMQQPPAAFPQSAQAAQPGQQPFLQAAQPGQQPFQPGQQPMQPFQQPMQAGQQPYPQPFAQPGQQPFPQGANAQPFPHGSAGQPFAQPGQQPYQQPFSPGAHPQAPTAQPFQQPAQAMQQPYLQPFQQPAAPQPVAPQKVHPKLLPQHPRTPEEIEMVARNTLPPRNSVLARVLLWALVVLCVFAIGGSVSEIQNNTAEAISVLLCASGGLLASGWSLYWRNQDRKSFEAWQQEQVRNADILRSLGDTEPILAQSLAYTPPPARHSRRWAIVGTLSAALLFVGVLISEPSEDAPAPTPEENSSSDSQ